MIVMRPHSVISFVTAGATTLLIALFVYSPLLAGVAQASVVTLSSTRDLVDLNPLNPDAYRGLKDIYISDLGYSAVQVLKNKGFFVQGSITAGLSLPAGNTLDRAGNLYVADYGNTVIGEYRPGIAQPFKSYSAGMIFPVNVTVDRKGDVFEADYGNGLEYDGFVNEYRQGRNNVLLACSPGGSVESVAVDGAGDVFVAYNLQSGGKILEYKGGLSGCKATGLGVTLGSAGGMVLDKSGNLIVADLVEHTIDVVAPPYTSVTRKMGPSYGYPNNVAINRDNTKVFASDPENAAVYVIDYATGTTLAVIKGLYFGLTAPDGVVDGPNAVY